MGTSLKTTLQMEIQQNQTLGLNAIWAEAILGVAMFLLTILTFSIRSFPT